MFATLGMNGEYSDQQLCNALKHCKGDVNKSMDLLLGGGDQNLA